MNRFNQTNLILAILMFFFFLISKSVKKQTYIAQSSAFCMEELKVLKVLNALKVFKTLKALKAIVSQICITSEFQNEPPSNLFSFCP